MGTQATFPPHARGWTFCSSRRQSERKVSPARAGMDPLASEEEHAMEGFPRTRGDGPAGQ